MNVWGNPDWQVVEFPPGYRGPDLTGGFINERGELVSNEEVVVPGKRPPPPRMPPIIIPLPQFQWPTPVPCRFAGRNQIRAVRLSWMQQKRSIFPAALLHELAVPALG